MSNDKRDWFGDWGLGLLLVTAGLIGFAVWAWAIITAMGY